MFILATLKGKATIPMASPRGVGWGWGGGGGSGGLVAYGELWPWCWVWKPKHMRSYRPDIAACHVTPQCEATRVWVMTVGPATGLVCKLALLPPPSKAGVYFPVISTIIWEIAHWRGQVNQPSIRPNSPIPWSPIPHVPAAKCRRV